MAKSYKLKDDNYIDSDSIIHNQSKLKDILTYSTQERKIGTWIDGKPLYRKIVSGQMPQVVTDGTNVSSLINFSIANVDFIIAEWAFIVGKYDNKIYNFPIPFTHHDVPTWYASYDIYATSVEVRNRWSRLNSHTAIFSLLYTKTTD